VTWAEDDSVGVGFEVIDLGGAVEWKLVADSSG